MATVEGGYNYRFVEPPPERLLCKICRLPCREAQSSEGHVYCKRCISRAESSDSVDRDVKALKVYCPNKKDGCGWIGEIARVDDHMKGCEISCNKCKQIVYFSTMRSHLDTECPCYCPYCDITATREVISSEHKEKCSKFRPSNIGVDNGPQDKFDIKPKKTNELQNNISEKINESLNPSILAELQKDISIIKENVALSIQIAKESSEKGDKQNGATLMGRLCNISSYLTVAVLIIAILIALLLLSPRGMSEDQMVEHLNSLQVKLKDDITQNITELHLFQEILNRTVKLKDDTTQNITELHWQIVLLQEMVAHYHCQLNNSVWFKKLQLYSENLVAPVILKMDHFTRRVMRVMNKGNWWSEEFFAFEEGYQVFVIVTPAGFDDGENTHVSLKLYLTIGPYDDELEQSGHWPLRGTFTIELLNQLNDSDHYHYLVKSDPSERVKVNNTVIAIDIIPQFIPLEILFQHNGYLKNDMLIFRVSYLPNKEDDA